jgi:hypothetical protein
MNTLTDKEKAELLTAAHDEAAVWAHDQTTPITLEQVDAKCFDLFVAKLADRTSSAGSAVVMPDLMAWEVIKEVQGTQTIDWKGTTAIVIESAAEAGDVARAILAAAAAQPAKDEVPLPQNADQAALMALLGTQYLEQHAPDRLRTPTTAQQPVAYRVESVDCEEFRKLADAYHCVNKQEDVEPTYDALFQWVDKEVERQVSAAIAAAQAAPVQADSRDAERLDYVLDCKAFICTIDEGMHQLMKESDDGLFDVISGEGQAFRTRRQAIDAAMEIDAEMAASDPLNQAAKPQSSPNAAEAGKEA